LAPSFESVPQDADHRQRIKVEALARYGRRAVMRVAKLFSPEAGCDLAREEVVVARRQE
jgi:hypothetical protein